MRWLIDRTKTTVKVVDGVEIHVRQMNRADVEEFARGIVEHKSDIWMRQEVAKWVEMIVGIPGTEGMGIPEVLREMADDRIDQVCKLVMEANSLTPDESKNSDSSPGMSSGASAGNLADAPATPGGSGSCASTTTNESPARPPTNPN